MKRWQAWIVPLIIILLITTYGVHHFENSNVENQTNPGESAVPGSLNHTAENHYTNTSEEGKGINNTNTMANNYSGYELLIERYPSLRNVLERARNVSEKFPDVNYPVRVFASIAERRNLTGAELSILNLTLHADLCYFSLNGTPRESYYVVSFSDLHPRGVPHLDCPNFTSPLPFVYYRGRGFQYYPVTASNWAYHYLKGEKVREAEAILNAMLPLRETRRFNGRPVALFNVYFAPPDTNVTPPWVSSFSQGMLAGLYAWLYNETGNETYLTVARELFNSFYLPLGEGGFVENTSYGLWFLEYPFRPDFLVLNGHIITMKGLWLYYRFTGDGRAVELFQRGVESVKRALPHCEANNWSLYAVNGPPAREDYHRLHVRLLVWLYVRTGDGIFLGYAERWNGYLEQRGLEPENITELLRADG
ncbi:D-glucuronyl C5-epimerase family protein [Thermococcus sp. 21S9]|uniref:D-glucuronyl C5-epimerase family protein n=1 Tax=Thermococcus sp. 21S9 TaxID=1638223 RepID=UPI001438B756|nr:D-glucuronyl C5-epimerase family protein [Thermococcus sp. 21S9]NJE54163.1 D-glucuronyl C5-epimerase [Thermococcus sp. 21S9]